MTRISSNSATAIAIAILLVVIAIVLDQLLLIPILRLILIQLNGTSFWVGTVGMCIASFIAYGLLAYLCVRFLRRYGEIPWWGFVVCFGTYLLAWQWWHYFPGAGWRALVFTYAPVVIAPLGHVLGAVMARSGRAQKPSQVME